MVMRFLLVCEGSSDTGLVPHIRRLVAGFGYPEPEGESWTRGRRLSEKVENALERLGSFDLMLIHRDADNEGPEARYRDIGAAVWGSEFRGPWVGIVPVRMTEAWLLLDEAAIRAVADRPFGREPLNLPLPRNVERIANPKSQLEAALLTARGVRGRRRRNFDREFFRARHQLLANLPAGGPLEQVPSWTRFRDDTVAALQAMRG